ncbi:MAG: carbohydrate ABC transporter permease [Anaerolineae bacterium]|nr:carbohydrate ABC transporter permease [Anaerolineae bacterium]
MCFPFFWMLVSSFKPPERIFSYPPEFIPTDPTLEHYADLPALIPSLGWNAVNSIALAVLTPLFGVFFSSLAGFAFAKFNFRGKHVLFAVVVLTQLIPPAAGFIPLFIEMINLRLIDTLWAVFLPGIVPAFGIFLFRQAIYSVPDELLDAGRIDGAGSFMLYRSVVIPLVMPMVLTQYILGFIGSWNNFLWPLIALAIAAELYAAGRARLAPGTAVSGHLGAQSWPARSCSRSHPSSFSWPFPNTSCPI